MHGEMKSYSRITRRTRAQAKKKGSNKSYEQKSKEVIARLYYSYQHEHFASKAVSAQSSIVT